MRPFDEEDADEVSTMLNDTEELHVGGLTRSEKELSPKTETKKLQKSWVLFRDCQLKGCSNPIAPAGRHNQGLSSRLLFLSMCFFRYTASNAFVKAPCS